MASTSDCKKFLVEFFRRNPQIVMAIYGGARLPEIHEIQAEVEKQKNWKREYKCKPGRGDHQFDRYTMYVDGVSLNRFAEPTRPQYREIGEFVSERGFRLDPMEDGVKYVVLEDKHGTLHLGDYIGD